MKVCSRCGRSLPQTEFWRRDRSPDGLQYRCKECMRPGHGQREAERKRSKNATGARVWRERNAERVRAYQQATQGRREAYSREARFRRRVANHLREANIVAALYASLNGLTPVQIATNALVPHWETSGIKNECKCGRPWNQIVHAVPLPNGGRHDVRNLIPLCSSCA